jgi:bacterial/archaeal transporter family protein
VTWLAYALTTVLLWTGWSFLGKIALRTVPPVQATILFGVASVVVGAVVLALGQRAGSWSPGTLWLSALSGLLGGIGLVTFYLALDRGRASLVAPVIGIYPALVALLSVAFLSERLSAVQALGVALAVTGVVLISAGG